MSVNVTHTGPDDVTLTLRDEEPWPHRPMGQVTVEYVPEASRVIVEFEVNTDVTIETVVKVVS